MLARTEFPLAPSSWNIVPIGLSVENPNVITSVDMDFWLRVAGISQIVTSEPS